MNTNEAQEEVMFPIEMLDYDVCRTCPEMEIEVSRLEIIAGDKIFYESRLKCKHYQRCKHLLDKTNTREKHAL